MLELRQLLPSDVADIFAAFAQLGWNKPASQYQRYVLPDFRRRRIGSRLMDEAEKIIVARSWTAGIGVGFGSDYGAAQRLYVLRGYVPDANGGTSRGMRVKWGDSVTVDDDLVLYFTKTLDSAKLRH